MGYLNTLSTKKAIGSGRKLTPAVSELAKKIVVSFKANPALSNIYRAKN
jgi:hypothetical protein